MQKWMAVSAVLLAVLVGFGAYTFKTTARLNSELAGSYERLFIENCGSKVDAKAWVLRTYAGYSEDSALEWAQRQHQQCFKAVKDVGDTLANLARVDADTSLFVQAQLFEHGIRPQKREDKSKG